MPIDVFNHLGGMRWHSGERVKGFHANNLTASIHASKPDCD
jgi:hypothetical protein